MLAWSFPQGPLTPDLLKPIEAWVASGRYKDANEVMRDALRRLQESEGTHAAGGPAALWPSVATLPQMLWLSDADGAVIRCNAALCEYAGIPECISQDHWLQLVHPADRQPYSEQLRQALIDGRKFQLTHRFRRADNVCRSVVSHAVAVRTPLGADRGWFGMLSDVSELVDERDTLKLRVGELERLVRERTRALADAAHELSDEKRRREEAEATLFQTRKLETMGSLTSGIIHDFNNLLAAIRGSYDLIRRRSDSDAVLNVVTHGEKAVARAQRLIEQLMSFVRREDVTPNVLNLADCLPAMQDLVCHATGAGMQCRFDIDPDVWSVVSDPIQLETALLNLVTNARDAMDRVGEVVVTARNLSAPERPSHLPHGDYVAIAVSDRGRGMPPEVLARAAEQFYTTKPQGQGTGLGLPMVFGFAERLGGAVQITSALGEGTRVEMILPRAPVDASASASSAVHQDRTLHGNATILLVEDDDQLRHIVAGFLRELGYEVVVCGSGESALAMVQTLQRLDLLVTDIELGGASGKVLAERLRADRPGLPVLFVTGVVTGGELAGEFIVPKPFTMSQLSRAVLEQLGRRLPPDGAGDKLLPRLEGSVLRAIYLEWRDARVGDAGLPPVTSIDLERSGLSPYSFMVAVQPTQPLSMTYVSVGNALTTRLGRNLSDTPVSPLEDTDEILGQLTRIRQRCAHTGRPVYQFARFDFGDGEPLRFERLVLPCSDDGQRVTHLVGIVLFQEHQVQKNQST